jgi:hypothetical protein
MDPLTPRYSFYCNTGVRANPEPQIQQVAIDWQLPLFTINNGYSQEEALIYTPINTQK